ncbi:MAG TPA: SRPBCC domain-containing protein [Longimicrobium sp.]
MTRIIPLTALALALLPAAITAQQQTTQPQPSPRSTPTGAFIVEQRVTVPGAPAEVFAAITGDLLPWWDHHVFPNPQRLYLEPRVGGCFCEMADSAGNGVRHAVVTVVDRPKTLRYEGPLGLTGFAVDAVTTYSFQPRGDSTVVKVEFHAAGEMPPGLDAAVNGVWRHFLVERFKPWYERTRGTRR